MMAMRRTFFRHMTSSSTSTTTGGDPSKTRIIFPFPPGSRKRRQDVRSNLRDVSRVHTPESDMRPILPRRDLLLRSIQHVSNSSSSSTSETSTRRPRPTRRGLAQAADDIWKCAFNEDMRGLERVSQRVLKKPLPTEKMTRWSRAIVMNGLLGGMKASLVSSSGTAVVDEVMSVFTENGMMDILSSDDVGAVLDVLILYNMHIGEDSAAFRGELMSRALETTVSVRAYAGLIEKCDRLDAALSLLHRVIAIGRHPTTAMLNRVLELCFADGDGLKAKRVVAEMARRGLKPDRRTLEVLLSRADGIDGVDAVFGVVKRAVAPPSRDTAEIFLRAYAAVGVGVDDVTEIEHDGDESNGNAGKEVEYVGKCFAVIDWFFDAGVGVGRHEMDALVEHFAHRGHVEAALRAWREMRRAWLGDPSIRSRGALYAALIKRGSERDEALQVRLLKGLDEIEAGKVKRLALRDVDDEDVDDEVLSNSSSCVKDKATVLHRQMRMGHSKDVYTWIEDAIQHSNGRGIDVRLLLPLLSDSSESQKESVLLLLEHLTKGKAVAGNRDDVIKRVVNRLAIFIAEDITRKQLESVAKEGKEEGGENVDLEMGGCQWPTATDILKLTKFNSNVDEIAVELLNQHGMDEEDEGVVKMLVLILMELEHIVHVCGDDGHKEQ